MKSAREYLVDRIKQEKTAFVKVMKAVPEDKLDYRPHPKSMSAQDLVWLLACELGDAAEVIDTGKAEWKQRCRLPRRSGRSWSFSRRTARSSRRSSRP